VPGFLCASAQSGCFCFASYITYLGNTKKQQKNRINKLFIRLFCFFENILPNFGGFGFKKRFVIAKILLVEKKTSFVYFICECRKTEIILKQKS